MNIRIANPEDAKELVNIYKYYVENTTITFEYDTPTLEEFEIIKIFYFIVTPSYI